MKANGIDHGKMKKLARALNIPLPYANGLMERTWIHCGINKQQGDIGTWDDETIADNAAWPGEPEVLIEAMVKVGFIDKHDVFRYIVHDWPTHTGDFIHKDLVAKRARFADGSIPRIERRFFHDPAAILQEYLDQEKNDKGKAKGKGKGKGKTKEAKVTPPKPEPSESMKNFERFWDLYPRRINRDRALAAWHKLSMDIHEIVISGVKSFAHAMRNKKDREFIPHPATWLNQSRWSDEYEEDIDQSGIPWRDPTEEEIAALRSIGL